MAIKGWQYLTVDEIKASSPSSIAIGPFGSRMKSDLYTSAGVPVIRGNNLSDSHVLKGEFVYVSPETADELAGCNVFPGDLVFPHRGAIGEVGIVPADGPARFILSTSLMKLTCNRALAEPMFLFYFFRSRQGRHELLKNASTVGTPGIGQPLTSLRSIRVPVPEIPEQRAIIGVLSDLDNKIELNRQTNRTLEAITGALFKSWFVDFDPARANSNRREPRWLGPIADLFPDSFEASTRGPVPKGWQVKTIRELCSTIQYGLTTSGHVEPVGPKFLRITDIQGGWVNWGTVPHCDASPEEIEKYRLCPHDVVVARTGASTGENLYLPTVPNAVFASYLVRFQFSDPSLARMVGAYMRTQDYFEYIANCIGGSAQPNASAQVLASAHLVVPPENLVRNFAATVWPMDLKSTENDKESQVLSELRDVLLPKLIAGELRVKDAEREIAEYV